MPRHDRAPRPVVFVRNISHLFGRVGRAPLRALYDKAHTTASTLNTHTRTAIISLREILSHCLPRTVPLQPHPIPTTIIYTDAFFSDGQRQFRNSDFEEDDYKPDFDFDYTNGWAAVIFQPNSKPFIIYGSVPRKILQRFASNKAYIYFLEAWAAIITPVLVQPLLTQPHAINRGSGKHQQSHWLPLGLAQSTPTYTSPQTSTQ